MAIRPSVPEIITVNSEALQTQIRDLLPSQNGFGSELQATNVITPIIDLTAAAEGSGLPISMQQAIAFGSQTAFEVTGTSTVIGNSPGFYRIFGVLTCSTGASNTGGGFTMTDGLSVKQVWAHIDAGHATLGVSGFDFIVFLASGESISAFADSANIVVTGSIRQVATGDGTLVQPNGYPL